MDLHQLLIRLSLTETHYLGHHQWDFIYTSYSFFSAIFKIESIGQKKNIVTFCCLYRMAPLSASSGAWETQGNTFFDFLRHYHSASFVGQHVCVCALGVCWCTFWQSSCTYCLLSCRFVSPVTHWLPLFPKIQTNSSSDKQTAAFDACNPSFLPPFRGLCDHLPLSFVCLCLTFLWKSKTLTRKLQLSAKSCGGLHSLLIITNWYYLINQLNRRNYVFYRTNLDLEQIRFEGKLPPEFCSLTKFYFS